MARKVFRAPDFWITTRVACSIFEVGRVRSSGDTEVSLKIRDEGEF